MPYCETTDLLISGIAMSPEVNVQSYVQDAADQIDSAIGFRYETPIDITVDSSVVRPAILLLKRINVLLASARLLMRLDYGNEGNRPNQLAMEWLKEAVDALKAIVDGKVDLEGAVLQQGVEDSSGPLIFNEDSDSLVATFYQRVQRRSYWDHFSGDIVSGLYG